MKKYIIANWKMNDTHPTAVQYVSILKNKKKLLKKENVVLSPPHTMLADVARDIKGISISISAQDVFPEKEGAYTGEICASLLKKAGATYVIIGHSERRHKLGETDAEIAEKVHTTLNEKLTPILCVGETLNERNLKKTRAVLKRQLTSAFKYVKAKRRKILIAYEPVWAISTSGSSRKITLTEIDESMKVFKKVVESSVPKIYKSSKIHYIYGGSVNEKNAKNIFSFSSIDGVLVGGASLDIKKFQRIIESA
jgi:triosephosphate isomerase